jgi:AcrR family transcriptional regulator
MTRLANTSTREYHSELRARQAEETRDRILEATARVMARGIATISIPAIAREAGVSVPTVYRHFRTKQDLLAAVYPYGLKRAGVREPPFPGSLDELKENVRLYAEHVGSFDELTRAAMASPASAEVRALSIPRRLAMIERLVDSFEPPLVKADRERMVRLLAVLLNSSALRTWSEVLGASGEQVAADVDWMVRAALAASRRKDR